MNSSYYSLPTEANSVLWVERTPDDFVFHVKSLRLFTGRQTPVEALPEHVRPTERRPFRRQRGGATFAVLATLWEGTKSALDQTGEHNLVGKLVIDATNPLDFSHGPALALGHSTSGGEQVQAWLPAAKVVKAFNTVTALLMFKPDLPGGPPTMFFAGNDPVAKQKVGDLLSQFGWHPIDIGEIDGARLLEPLAMLYIRHAIRANNWQIAFKLLESNG